MFNFFKNKAAKKTAAIEEVRSLVKLASDKKAEFESANSYLGRNYLDNSLNEPENREIDILPLYSRAIEAAFVAGKSAFQCNELTEIERRYWANHHIASEAYLKMSVGLPEEAWKQMQNAALDMEVVERNGGYFNEHLKTLTEIYSNNTYYSSASLHVASGIALGVLEGCISEAKGEFMRAAELIDLNESHDISNAFEVILEVSRTLLSMPLSIVSPEEVITVSNVGITRVLSHFTENQSLSNIIRTTHINDGVLSQLVELVDLQALSYDLLGNNKEYKRLNDAILKSDVPTPWRESDTSIYSRIISTRT
jgi:hypothetical protein